MKSSLKIKNYKEDDKGLYLDTTYDLCSVSVDKNTGDVFLHQGEDGYENAVFNGVRIESFTLKGVSIMVNIHVHNDKNSDTSSFLLGEICKKDKTKAIEWIQKCNKIITKK